MSSPSFHLNLNILYRYVIRTNTHSIVGLTLLHSNMHILGLLLICCIPADFPNVPTLFLYFFSYFHFISLRYTYKYAVDCWFKVSSCAENIFLIFSYFYKYFFYF